MENNYIIRHKDNTLSSLYYYSNKIIHKTYSNYNWNEGNEIIKKVKNNFTVNLSSDGTIYLFCQDLNGNVNLCQMKNQQWKNKVILENKNTKDYPNFFNSIITKTGLTLIYNSISNEDDNQFIHMQQLLDNGSWSKAITIDKFSPMKTNFFSMEKVSDEHFLLFYQTRNATKSIGYREINSTEFGKYNSFHSTSYNIVDTSYLTTDNCVFVSYIVKSNFSSQLIFRKKCGESFSNPIILGEGQNLDNSLVYFSSNILYLFFTNGLNMYYTTSSNYGETFKKVQRFKTNIATDIIKGKYLSEIKGSESSFFASNVYLDKTTPNIIKILPEVNSDMYPTSFEIKKDDVVQKKENNPHIIDSDLVNELKEKNLILKNRLATKEKDLKEKDIKILELTKLLFEKNKEINNIIQNKK